eukprot:CAMPEP_0201687466 /NCGR_PEP_ID=MMETSP0578-20130828/1518_1 /ASSEMBLY_ACC=CAM_ASM_000663 /TAXON_ID=267565 /ORGANISM="Skeletonema grethea, Strain CCMP 1804" /LENGTH=474 /DNA_ID=CAMNT_0048171625 /DNA_START=15 /DNA_END=1439 /DNA_ORIENTATION=-
MISSQEDIASKLLQSSDARIAEAAKRVFSLSNYPVAAMSTLPEVSNSVSSGSGSDKKFTADTAADQCQDGDHEMSTSPQNKAGGGKHTANITSGPIDTTTTNEEAFDDAQAGDKKPSSTERLQRSRERNRMHARKTRQRKKEHMQKLQNRADELKAEQIRLKQCINEKNTANILVGLFQTGEDSAAADGSDETETAVSMDPQVEVLLKRPTEEIPDASKIPELPALILPGQHTKRKSSSSNDGEDNAPASAADGEGITIPEGEQEDGIDYVLLGKDRGSCTPAELDQIRRERNRMHAKRTRDRKRIFMEEMETMIKQLEDENALLQGHMDKLNENEPDENIAAAELLAATASLTPPPAISPELGPVTAPSNSSATADPLAAATSVQPSKGDFLNQIESLLAAAGAFERNRSQCEVNAISISCAASDVTDQSSYGCDDDHSSHDNRPCKKQRRHLEEEDRHASVPKSITTTNLSL